MAIGPHEGQELKMLLYGQKNLALFMASISSGDYLQEDIIPERKFEPYVRQSKIIRKHKDIEDMRVVCFSIPQFVWAMDFVFWVKEQTYRGYKFPNHADDIMIGKLLGYDDIDIKNFLRNLEERL